MKIQWNFREESVKSAEAPKIPPEPEIEMDKRARFWYNGSMNLAEDSFGENMQNFLPLPNPNRFTPGFPSVCADRNPRGTRIRLRSRRSGVPLSAYGRTASVRAESLHPNPSSDVFRPIFFTFLLIFIPLGIAELSVRKEARP